MTSDTRAQRLVDEFEQAASFYGGFSVRHGIAAVLRHLADTDAQYGDESFYAVPTRTLEDLADALLLSLKEQALAALHAVATGANDIREQHQDLDTIRRALEQLNG